jgi:pimeloyl-ACP methyl ester carboxylesterase
VLDQLAVDGHCVAIDLPLHGRTPATVGQDFSLPALARFVAECCDALGLDGVDLVANDTGAIAQIFAAQHPQRLTSLTLTNCETHDNLPPKVHSP